MTHGMPEHHTTPPRLVARAQPHEHRGKVEQAGIEPIKQHRVFRVDDGKQNMAPLAELAEWRQLGSVEPRGCRGGAWRRQRPGSNRLARSRPRSTR